MNNIDVMVVADHGFVMQCGVMLMSLCSSNKDSQVNIHLMTDETFTNEDRTDIENIVKYVNAQNTLSVNVITDDMLGDWDNGHSYYTKHVFFRLFIDLLPSNIDRVLYLDSDIIVRNHLSELWDIDLSGFAVAGAPDASEQGFSHGFVRGNDVYFNAGVLLMNLTYWRENHCKDILFSYINEHRAELRLNEQDAMNIIFKETKKHLDIKYNLQPIALYKDKYITFPWQKYGAEFRNAQINPSIIHFAGARPWEKGCTHPYKEEWYKYQRMTKWADVPLRPSRVTMKEHLKNVIRAILTPIGICHYVYDYYNRNLRLV